LAENGGNASEDVRVIDKCDRQVGFDGIDKHQIIDIPIVMDDGVI